MKTPVSIRPVELSDADSVQKYASDVRLHATCNLPSPYPEGCAASFVVGCLKAHEAGKQYTFTILNSGEFGGLMGLNDVRPEEKTAELDYWIGFPFWGKGIATSAASLVIAHAFQDLGLETLFSGGLIRNPASLRVVQKNGFTKIAELIYAGPWMNRFGGEMLARYRLQAEEYKTKIEQGGATNPLQPSASGDC